MRVVIDRFEGQFALCETENKKMILIETAKLPRGSKEGDILEINGEIITIDTEATEKSKKEIEDLTKDLWK